mgnify:FL=1
MIEGGKENEVQKKYRNGDECPDGSGNACRMRIKWQYIIKYCIRQCIICIGRGINRRSYDFYL